MSSTRASELGSKVSNSQFPAGGSELGQLMRRHDWSTSSLGLSDSWPPSVRGALQLMLASRFPMFVAWGPDLTFLYNDSYAQLLGNRHPSAFGQPFAEVWPEVWSNIQPLVNKALEGEATLGENMRLVLMRNGYPESSWWTFSYGPILDDDGISQGLFCTCIETTIQVRAERRQALRQSLEEQLTERSDPMVIVAEATALLGKYFGKAKVGFVEVDYIGDNVVVSRDWTNGRAPIIAEKWFMDGAELRFIQHMKVGSTITISDVQLDERTDDPATMAALDLAGARAIMDVPLIRDGQIRALMFIHSAEPRAWTVEDAAFATEALGQLWSAVSRAKAEKHLRESEEFNRRMLASSADCIKVLDNDARIEFINDGGLCTMEVEDFDAFKGTSWLEFWKGEDHVKALAAVEEAKMGGTGRFQGFTPTMKGSPRWWDVIVTSINGEDGNTEKLLVISRDITERKRIEEQLHDLNESLEARVEERTKERDRTWNNARDLLLVVDTDGIFRAANPAWTTILGWMPDEVIGRSYLEFIHPEDHPSSEDALETASQDIRGVYANRHMHKDGSYRWISWVAAPEANMIYASGRDISEEKAREEELVIAREALRQSQKMDAMGQLTGGVAHDFNNLLTPIILTLDFLKRTSVGGELEQQLIDIALQSSDRAKVLIQRLLSFARRQPLQAVPVYVSELITGMADLISRTIGPQVEIVMDIAENLPAALADANQLEMALLNLGVNARDAMPDGGTLRISAVAETIKGADRSGVRAGAYIRLSVADTGTGMAEETAGRAIEPFFSTKGVGQGTGLGLSMVHGLAKQLGGGMVIKSKRGIGTTIDLLLPITNANIEKLADISHEIASHVHCGTALLVDDDEFVRISTAAALNRLGYNVVEAPSGEHALSILQNGLCPDVVVTDHLMPGMSGTELAKYVQDQYPGVKILIISGYADVGGIASDLPRLTKPFRNDELAAALAAPAATQVQGNLI